MKADQKKALIEAFTAMGYTQEDAARMVEDNSQHIRKNKRRKWVLVATEYQTDEIRAAFPDVTITEPTWRRVN